MEQEFKYYAFISYNSKRYGVGQVEMVKLGSGTFRMVEKAVIQNFG